MKSYVKLLCIICVLLVCSKHNIIGLVSKLIYCIDALVTEMQHTNKRRRKKLPLYNVLNLTICSYLMLVSFFSVVSPRGSRHYDSLSDRDAFHVVPSSLSSRLCVTCAFVYASPHASVLVPHLSCHWFVWQMCAPVLCLAPNLAFQCTALCF